MCFVGAQTARAFSVKKLVHGETGVTAVSLQSSRAHVFVDVWLQRDCKRRSWNIVLSVLRVLCIVAGSLYVVSVSRSDSVPFIIFLLPLVASLSVFPRSLLYD